MSNLESLLAGLEDLDKNRTEGPWALYGRDNKNVRTEACSTVFRWMEIDNKTDSKFIVAAANEMSKLIKIIRLQQQALFQAKATETLAAVEGLAGGTV